MSEKSDKAIVPKKSANKVVKASAELMEGRALPKGNSQQTAANWTQSQGIASLGLQAVRQVAKKDRKMKFTNLLHHVSHALLRQSFFELNRRAATGSDGMTWKEYQRDLDQNLEELHQRIHRGSYRARPARRLYIPKPDGTERPLSIWCLEDKIVQQAVVHVLNSIYENDFLGFSYGFRPGRGQHDALDALQVALYRKKVNWVLDADIQKFFDRIDHEWMMQFLRHRITDKRLLRLIAKWLKVGVFEDGQRHAQTRGTPQGAVISPVLANIYLHYAFDLWVDQWRRQRARGDVFVVRYADDTVLGFQFPCEAQRFQEALVQRLDKFGLTLHPEKTRLIQFGRYAQRDRATGGLGKPETFDFLGFTHYCTRSHKEAWFVVGRRTIAKRMRAQLKAIKEELKRRLHRPIHETGCWLNRVLRGHLAYYSVPGNVSRCSSFVYHVRRLWFRSLRRRSQRTRMTWSRFGRLARFHFPPVRVLHPYPLHRFDAKYPREEPSALVAHAGICTGGAG